LEKASLRALTFSNDKSAKLDRQKQADKGAADSTQQQPAEKSNPCQRF
jgi:hypothetical protein